jgi:hypothetical protein
LREHGLVLGCALEVILEIGQYLEVLCNVRI